RWGANWRPHPGTSQTPHEMGAPASRLARNVSSTALVFRRDPLERSNGGTVSIGALQRKAFPLERSNGILALDGGGGRLTGAERAPLVRDGGRRRQRGGRLASAGVAGPGPE